MSNLQLALIVAGIALVLGVVLFNRWQERRLRRRIEASSPRPPREAAAERSEAARVEPTLRARDDAQVAAPAAGQAAGPAAATPAAVEPPQEAFAIPMDVIEHEAAPAPAVESVAPRGPGVQPDPDIEAIVVLRPPQPLPATALAPIREGRFAKPVRWFGCAGDGAPWTLLDPDSAGSCAEFAGCLLLADRKGPLSRNQIDTFVRTARDFARTLPAEFEAPDVDAEVSRAEQLDRLCADVDVQIGLTLLKPDSSPIAGTRLRGVAEASGFRLTPGGRFEYLHEETGQVEYALANLRSEPFTAESLRLTATHGLVFMLDIPRVVDPPRSFDRMKLAAKRMAVTLQAQMVDDNRRPLDDAALATIRAQVDTAAQALSRVHIEPGSARARALFSA